MMNLPILSSRFFEEHRPQLGFFSQWSSIYKWSEKILPLYQWQGVLFVGCLRPPHQFPPIEKMKVVFVLCEAGALQDLWLDFQAPQSLSASPSASAPASVPEPAASVPPAKLSSSIPTKSTVEEEDLFSTVEISEAPPEEEVQESALEDEKSDPHPDHLLDLNVDLNLGSSSTYSVTLEPLGDSPLKPMKAPASEPEEKTQTKFDKEDSLSFKRATPLRSEVLNMGEVTRKSHDILNSSSPGKNEAWMEKLFTTMSASYQKSMILLKMGDQARPWKWDSHFKNPPASANTISLTTPSPFRIVSRTKKPYHGYVVMNDLNQKFFNEWNEGQVPEHLTIAPILVDDHVIGMLLAMGSKSADSKETLQMAETQAQSIAQKINGQTPGSKVA